MSAGASGCSGTPLAAKLGVKPGAAVNALALSGALLAGQGGQVAAQDIRIDPLRAEAADDVLDGMANIAAATIAANTAMLRKLEAPGSDAPPEQVRQAELSYRTQNAELQPQVDTAMLAASRLYKSVVIANHGAAPLVCKVGRKFMLVLSDGDAATPVTNRTLEGPGTTVYCGRMGDDSPAGITATVIGRRGVGAAAPVQASVIDGLRTQADNTQPPRSQPSPALIRCLLSGPPAANGVLANKFCFTIESPSLDQAETISAFAQRSLAFFLPPGAKAKGDQIYTVQLIVR